MAEERGDCNREITVFFGANSSRGDIRFKSIEAMPNRTGRKSARAAACFGRNGAGGLAPTPRLAVNGMTPF
ncbi:hypothetical protein [Mesorhizobium sp. B2-6-2]|uniref:hypothetical protein n=1 Tax=Mesorhizobium sp. B2-6-2 TaxID=2589915 RepID=UPI001129C9F6|nr:hypothetical protein [Mesorhizobium sp. B2-6-2]TPJ72644.1 hypothetical protein FJ419_27720 [Mesorhizobium sp. B2-6-2]